MWQFVKKKIIRLWPTMVFAIGLAFIFARFGWLRFDLYTNVLCLLGLNGTGLSLKLGNIGVFWYVSSMMWTMVLLYYLLQNIQRKHVRFIVVCAVFFCYSFLIHAKGGSIDHHVQTFGYVFNVAMMRAIAGISVGCLIGEWYRQNLSAIQNYLPSKKAKFFITMTELVCLGFLVRYWYYKPFGYQNELIYIIVFAAIVILFLMNKGYVSRFFDRDIWVRLAQYTYACYITHSLLLQSLRNSIWPTYIEFVRAYPIITMMLTFMLIITVGVLSYHFVEVPAKRYLTRMDKAFESGKDSNMSAS